MSLIVRDINAHYSRSDMNTNEDERGEQLADGINTADYTILNENEATWLPTNCRSTTSNISLASSYIALLSDWSVSTSLASDHLPILITINYELLTTDGPRRTYINLMKVDWARYAEICYEYLAVAGETKTFEQADKTTKAVNKASVLAMPDGRIRHFQPSLRQQPNRSPMK